MPLPHLREVRVVAVVVPISSGLSGHEGEGLSVNLRVLARDFKAKHPDLSHFV